MKTKRFIRYGDDFGQWPLVWLLVMGMGIGGLLWLALVGVGL